MTAKKTTIMPRNLVRRLLQGLNSNRRGYASTGDQVLLKAKSSEMGLERLGTGAYSVVLSHPHDKKKVIKITLSKSDGYHKYVEWVQKVGPTLPKAAQKHLPIIYKSTLIDGARVTILERLTKSGREAAIQSTSYYGVVGLVSAMSAVLKLRDDQGCNNVLVRGGRTAVITDPWAH